jgi:hypothetical protein
MYTLQHSDWPNARKLGGRNLQATCIRPNSAPGRGLSVRQIIFKFISKQFDNICDSCAFYNDLYKAETPEVATILRKLLFIRKNIAYGASRDFFYDRNCVAWVRDGDEEHPDGCVVVLNNGTQCVFFFLRVSSGKLK